MERDLKPCPFCGSDEVELDSRRCFTPLGGGEMDTESAIYCLKCPAEVSFCHADFDGSKDDCTAFVVEQWNQRVPQIAT